jgi:hypothetical protein
MMAAIDCYSKLLWLFPIPRKEAHFVARCLELLFTRMNAGVPDIVQCDNGREFDNSLMTALAVKYNFQVILSLNKLNVKLVHSRPYHPQSQGVVERQNQTIGLALARYEAICAQKNQPFDWSDLMVVGRIQDQYNNSYHSAIGMTPFEAFHCRKNGPASNCKC